MSMHDTLLIILLSPLVGALIAGLFGWKIGRAGAHLVTTASVALSTYLAAGVFYDYVWVGGVEPYNASIYTWMVSDHIRFEAGFMVDRLTATMMLVVTFVSLMVHVYTIGYMEHEETGYERFFSYISLFTFSMLSLVMSNNFLQLFFGWEAVGLVSYLLIGFYFNRESANQASLKAFLVNRVGDFGFVLGIALVVGYFGTLDYVEFFKGLDALKDTQINLGGTEFHMLTVLTMLLFVGAMGKSAQMPLHVWLPESMEGPTPISALIHAATMVTAGIFMVARLSPAYELAEGTLTFILLTGAFTALFMGLLGIVQNDIKRVVAYSTLSQLGYMIAALGVSAYSAGMFHVLTHAFFKALLFLAAGSVIIAMHHDQDIRNMGGLAKKMPVTYVALLVGSLALIGFPGFSGFFSKDGILFAIGTADSPAATLAFVMLLIGVFVTAFYSFRMFFIVFHGPESNYVKTHEIKESPLVVTIPLILLSIPAIGFGFVFVEDILFGTMLSDAIKVLPEHDVLKQISTHGETAGHLSAMDLLIHGIFSLPTLLALSGAGLAWFLYIKRPTLVPVLAGRFGYCHRMLKDAYGFDRLNDVVFVRGARGLGHFFSQVTDAKIIDGWMVNGSANSIANLAQRIRHGQTGYLYHYAFVMIFGLMAMLAWALW
jgi:NADH-quinone oxidoreductase subunit L